MMPTCKLKHIVKGLHYIIQVKSFQKFVAPSKLVQNNGSKDAALRAVGGAYLALMLLFRDIALPMLLSNKKLMMLCSPNVLSVQRPIITAPNKSTVVT